MRLDYYRDVEGFDRYVWGTEEAENRLKEFEGVYERISDYLNGKIVDVGCGAGLFTFFLEQKGHDVTGVEVNEDFVRLFEETKQKHGFRSSIIHGDAERVDLGTKHDVAVFMGNTLWHFSPKKLVNIVGNLECQGVNTFIFHYRSLVKLLFNKEWKEVFPDGRILAITGEYNDEEGYIQSVYMDIELEKKPTRERMYVWAVYVLDGVMHALGYERALRGHVPADMCEVLDVYVVR